MTEFRDKSWNLGLICTICMKTRGSETFGIRLTVPDVWPAVSELHDVNGCCLHIVLEDGNVQDHDVQWCLDYARAKEHHACALLAAKLLHMTRTQRRVLYLR